MSTATASEHPEDPAASREPVPLREAIEAYVADVLADAPPTSEAAKARLSEDSDAEMSRRIARLPSGMPTGRGRSPMRSGASFACPWPTAGCSAWRHDRPGKPGAGYGSGKPGQRERQRIARQDWAARLERKRRVSLGPG